MKLTTSMLTGLPAQDVFDIAAWHMLEQNARASNGSMCQYRAPNGRRCAIGWLIPDEEYRMSFEGCGIGGLIAEANKMHCSPEFVAFLMEHQRLLGHLQSAHDQCPVDAWPTVLHQVALAHDLRSGVLDHFEAKRRERYIEARDTRQNSFRFGDATLTIGAVKLPAFKVLYASPIEYIDLHEPAPECNNIGMIVLHLQDELAKACALPVTLLTPVTQEKGHEFAEHEETREAAPA